MTTTSPYRFGGWSGILVAASTLMATVLVVLLGTPPTDAEGLLRYLSRSTTPWTIIVILGILADLLVLPFAYALYRALRDVRNLALAGCGLLMVIAVLDLAVRWPTYAALITLAGPWKDATTTELEALTGAAGHASAVLGSFLWPVYFTLVPGIAILLSGVAWYRAELNRWVGYVGLAVGTIAMIAFLAGVVTSSLAVPMLATSAAMAVWFAVAGYALLRLEPT